MRVRTRQRKLHGAGGTRLALDIGTEAAKALVVSVGEGATLLGVGRARQRLGDMEDGAVARIPGVVASCQKAIEDAYSVSGHSPIEAVVGIAGEHVQGFVTTMQFRRRRPARPISTSELRGLLAQLRQKAHTDAIALVESQTGLRSVDMELLGSSVLEVKIDGYRVRSPLQFRGTYIELSVFHTFSPLVHISAIRTVADRLGLVLIATVAEPHAVAMGLVGGMVGDSGAVLIDIGGGSTDVAVIRSGSVVATKSIPIGGRSFTRSIAKALQIEFDEAEAMKLDYSMGVLDPSLSVRLEQVLHDDLIILSDALRLAFEDVSHGQPLPPVIYLCGGGAALRGVDERLEEHPWPSSLFAQQPTTQHLVPADVEPLADPDLHLSGMRDVTPKSLAVQAARYAGSGPITRPASDEVAE